jgi:asparagine synthase (glutamine-hydrolysing)
MDSSSIACVARHIQREMGEGPLHTFSAVFDGVPKSNERPYIEAVLAGGDVAPYVMAADEMSPLADLEQILWHHDQVSTTGNIYLNWHLAGVAHKRGIRVLLDGFDGDTTLSHGHGYLVELAHARRWPTLAREMREYGRKARVPEPWGRAFIRWLWMYEVDPVVARLAPLRLGRRAWQAFLWRAQRRGGAVPVPEAALRLIRPEFARRAGAPARASDAGSSPTRERDYHYQRLIWDVNTRLLEVLDTVASAHALELRFPFWDRRLAEFCLALPAEQKRKNGWSRWICRPALEGVLPSAIQWRGTKSNMSYALDAGLQKFERERLDTLVLRRPDLVQEYIDVDALRTLYRTYVAGDTTPEESLALWRVLSLDQWLQKELPDRPLSMPESRVVSSVASV